MKKSNGKFVLFVIIFLLVIIVAIGSYLVLATDMFKSPQELFSKYLSDTFVQVSEFNAEPYGSALEKMKTEPTKIEFTSNMEVDASSSYTYDDEDDEETAEKAEIEMKLTLMSDTANEKSDIALDVTNNDEDFLNLELLYTDNTFGIYVDGLYDDYIAIKNENLKEFVKNLTDTEDESTLEQIPDSISNTALSDEEIAKLKEIFSNSLNDLLSQIDSSNYSSEAYTIDNLNGQSYSGNKYTLTISTATFLELIESECKNIVEDEGFVSLLEARAADYALENLKEKLAEFEEEIEVIIGEESTANSTLKISVYESDQKTIRIDILKDEEKILEFTILNGETSSNMNITTVTLKDEDNYSYVGSEQSIDISNTYTNNSGELKITEATTYNQDDIEALKEEMSSLYSSYNEDYDYDDYYDEMYEDTEETITITTTLDGDTISGKITSDAEESEDIDIGKTTFTISFGEENVTINELTDDNSVVINDYSDSDFEELYAKIILNASMTAIQRPNSFIGSMSSLLSYFTGSSSTDITWSEIEDDEEDDDDYDLENEEDSEEIDESTLYSYQELVNNDIKEALEKNLEDYRNDAEENEDADPNDYLTIDKIEDATTICSSVELVDGTTLKSYFNSGSGEEYIFYSKINVDGYTWELTDIETLYSEDGTLENAVHLEE